MSFIARFKVWQVWMALLMAGLSPLFTFVIYGKMLQHSTSDQGDFSLSPLGWLMSGTYWFYTTLGALPALLFGLWARSKGTKLGLFFALLSYPWIFLLLVALLITGYASLFFIH